MGNRRLLLPARWKTSDAIFWGRCRKPLVNAYWGASAGVERFHYIDNGDGTYTYYAINGNKAKQWWDRFVWYNSDNVIDFHVSPAAQIWETNNNRFNSQSVESYDFGGKAIATKSLRETFYLCHNIDTIDISSWSLANNTSLYAAFAANVDENAVTKLRTVKLPADCGAKVTEAHKMFGWHRGLVTITGMTTVDFGSCTNFSEMFCECISLKNVDFRIDGWVTSKCTDIHSMFLKCHVLDFSAIGDFTTWDVSNVADVSGLFANNNAEYLDLTGWDLRNCNNFQLMFADLVNNNLKGIILSGWQMDTTRQAQYGGMFVGCTALKTLTLKGCATEVVDFFKSQLMTDLFATVSTGTLLLVLDDGTYKYDKAAGGWVANATS